MQQTGRKSLAALHASDNQPAEAVEIFEKILAFDYHYLDVEQRLIEARDLVQLLPPIETQEGSAANRSVGGAGGGQPGRYQIVGEHEADVKQGKSSIASPIARAPLPKEVGDVVEVNTPGGVKAYEILKVEWK